MAPTLKTRRTSRGPSSTAVATLAAASVFVLACLGAVACGSDAPSPGDSGGATTPAASADANATDTTIEGLPEITRLVFIHHSTGENWLADDNGGLGNALAAAGYFVSDTNYGWGPEAHRRPHRHRQLVGVVPRPDSDAVMAAALRRERPELRPTSRLATTPAARTRS